MGDVADELLALLVILDLLLRRLLQADPHLLKILAQPPQLVVLVLHLQGEIQISVPDVLGGLLQLSQGPPDGAVDPGGQSRAREAQDQHPGDQHLPDHGLHLRDQLIHIGHQKQAPLLPVGKAEIDLLEQVLAVPVQVDAPLKALRAVPVGGELIRRDLPAVLGISLVDDLLSLSHNGIGILPQRLLVELVQVISILKRPRILVDHLPDLLLAGLRQAAEYLHGIGWENVHRLRQAVILADLPCLIAAQPHKRHKNQQHGNHRHGEEGHHQSRLQFHTHHLYFLENIITHFPASIYKSFLNFANSHKKHPLFTFC